MLRLWDAQTKITICHNNDSNDNYDNNNDGNYGDGGDYDYDHEVNTVAVKLLDISYSRHIWLWQ